jgi:hypothetical protein
MTVESPLTAAQRAAIQEARARYEGGGLTVEQLKSTLDAITAAADASAVQAVVDRLPSAPHSPLAAFDLALPADATTSGRQVVSRIWAFMGETRRAGRPWTLAQQSQVSSTMGNVLVDLRQAKLPSHAKMRANAFMGQLHILVPPGVRVIARTRVIMANTNTLGEYSAGILGLAEVTHEPADGAPVAELEIDATACMAELKILVVDANYRSISDLAREAVDEALASVRTSLAERRAARAALNPGRSE